MKSYDYQHRQGIEEISWERFAAMTAQLTEALAPHRIDTIIGIARAGLFPATLVACTLRRELTPVRVTRRVDDVVQFASPIWRMDVPATVMCQRVAVIDEFADTGETLAMVATRALERGASQALTVSLVSHSWANPRPDVTALVSDAFVIFPWDRRVYQNGKWQPHPEIESALAAQKDSPNG